MDIRFPMRNFENKSKIIKVSTVISHILFAGLVVWGIGLPVVLFHALTLWFGSNLPATHVLPLGLLLVIGFRFIVTLKLFQFFDRLKDGHRAHLRFF